MHERDKVQTMCESMGSVSNGKRKKLSMSKVSDKIVKFLWSAIATTVLGATLIQEITQQRGYFAIGGEWVIILFFFYGFYRWMAHEKKAAHRK